MPQTRSSQLTHFLGGSKGSKVHDVLGIIFWNISELRQRQIPTDILMGCCTQAVDYCDVSEWGAARVESAALHEFHSGTKSMAQASLAPLGWRCPCKVSEHTTQQSSVYGCRAWYGGLVSDLSY